METLSIKYSTQNRSYLYLSKYAISLTNSRCSPTFIKLGNTGLAPCSKDFFHVSKMIICLQGWILYSNCVKDVKTDLKDRQFVIIILSYGWLQNRMVFTPTPPRPPYSHCIPEHYSFDNNFFHCSVLAAQFCLHYLSESCIVGWRGVTQLVDLVTVF